MSHPPTGPSDYEPVSVHADGHQDVPYDTPLNDPTTIRAINFDSQHEPSINSFDGGLPPGAARPRFMGQAAGDGPRESMGSFQGSYNESFNSSVYALNPNRGGPDSYGAAPYRDDPRDGDFTGSEANLGGMPMSTPGRSSRYLGEKRGAYAPKQNKRKIIVGSIIAGVIVVIIGVVVAIYFTVIKKNNNDGDGASGGTGNGNGNGNGGPTSNIVKSGGDGSTIKLSDGTTFTYSNKFGGTWYHDPNDPLNGSARPNSWTPPINQTFRPGIDRIFGVNLGGWLVPEPFIVPALFEKYLNNTNPAVDEWTLSQAMAADTQPGGGLSQMEDHYKTFITEKDFADIAGAGLNYVRIPFAYWAIEVWDGEPYLAKTSWKYFLKAIEWGRKYGIRINLDLHAVPGSQNGWNHSGRLGSINFLYGPMGFANAQRTLDYIRIIAEFISQPQYSDVVTMFGVLNEPRGSPILGQDVLSDFYGQAYQVVREASGLGEGNGPIISYHEGFCGLGSWAGFLQNGDRMALDYHPYICFGGQSSKPISSYATTPCSNWGSDMNKSMSAFGLTAAGEFSNAVTDCGLWLNGVNLGTRYEGTYNDGNSWPPQGSCDPWTDYQSWTDDEKAATKQFALASMDALQNWFFWTWKIGNSSRSGKVESPAWSYQLGLQEGWMPLDPRDSLGTCGNSDPWDGPLQPWQTGGSGAGNNVQSGSLAWPPNTFAYGGSVNTLPSYTPTGTIATLPVPSFSASSISAGNGWKNAADSAGAFTPIATCSYLDPWVGTADAPSPLCTGAAAPVRRYMNTASRPLVTPFP